MQIETRIENLDKEVFFILSTARCRSSWFANLFTYKNSFCFNEEFRYINNWDELVDRIEQRPEKYVGFGDPEMLHYIKDLYRLFPKATYVLLERDRIESQNSLAALSRVSLNLVAKKFVRWYNDIEVFKKIVSQYSTVHFNDMSNMKEIKRIWKYVLSDVSFDVQRWEMLDALLFAGTIGNKPYEPDLQSCMAVYFDFEKLKGI